MKNEKVTESAEKRMRSQRVLSYLYRSLGGAGQHQAVIAFILKELIYILQAESGWHLQQTHTHTCQRGSKYCMLFCLTVPYSLLSSSHPQLDSGG